MKIDGVFAGGGVRAFAFIGATQVLEEKGYTFERLAGTSAGALFSALLKAGYTSHELNDMLNELNVAEFMDGRKTILPFKWMKWAQLYFNLGMYKGDALEQWIDEKLAKKGIKTFADVPEGTLKIIASDLSRGQIVVLPDDLPAYGIIPEKFSIARAVRMSSSIPYFFEPVKVYNPSGKKSYIVDGGVLSNFPLWIFMKDINQKIVRPVLGFRLTPDLDEIPPHEIKNGIDMFQSLFETMRKAHDVRYIVKEHAKNIVFIPVTDVKATDFDLSEEKKEALILLGRERTHKFLKKWVY
ncbi:patatin-like phospholipase family protein [Alkalihalobacterium chitinilyticum]|uniref:Patatin-like phospholipase family protein n=1 Tax=Alkalihalobacterium chitinilyticum TaxID=2980103 RepID=A0ABT5V9Y4_9BACI|nr:patatin-like phospholipase family protein [Alkalihalobacterium chitinilyticum]MDE5412265.1 patatin-like phospholipase family protein [Alkalihalobacterium chitinilyticum]